MKYGKEGGITKDHIKEAAEYVFSQPRPVSERRVKFKIFVENEEQAQKWFENFLIPIFKEEVQKHIDKLNGV